MARREKRKRGRPRLRPEERRQRIQVWVPPEVLAQLEERAAAEGSTVGRLVAAMLARVLSGRR